MNGIVWLAGFIAIMLMLVVESTFARRQQRKPEPITVLVMGVVGIGYFVAMLYVNGQL